MEVLVQIHVINSKLRSYTHSLKENIIMPLDITDNLFGNTGYYADRTKMLNQLNEINKSAYVYNKDSKLGRQLIRDTLKQYPAQAKALMNKHTNSKIKALNELDFMDSDERNKNNPIAQLGAEGANTRLRIPIGWQDNGIPINNGRSFAFYNRPKDDLVVSMLALGNGNKQNNMDSVVHETMHRGFQKLGSPGDKPEHNYIYNKMRTDYGNTRYTPEQINTSWESIPGSRYESQANQQQYNEIAKKTFEDAAWNRLGEKY